MICEFRNVSDKGLSDQFNNSYPGIPPRFSDPKFYTEMERQKISFEMTRRLKGSTDTLNYSIKELDGANRRASNTMRMFTAFLIILTMLLALQTFIQFLYNL